MNFAWSFKTILMTHKNSNSCQDIDDLVQDCSNSIAWTKLLIAKSTEVTAVLN